MPVTNTPAQIDMKRVLTVVPARYGSSRFPGKPLASIHGKPMVQQVVERIKESRLAKSRYLVATDDVRISEALEPYSTDAVMTSVDCPSGSDRLWEALSVQNVDDYDWVVNIQGDEPFMSAKHLDTLLEAMVQYSTDADVVTLVTPYFGEEIPESLEAAKASLADINKVKALYSESGRVLYFSRQAIPCVRDGLELDAHCSPKAGVYYRHLGVYAYRVDALKRFVESKPTQLENLEKLEQLRALEMGFDFFAGVVPSAPVGVDTPEDLERLLKEHSA